MNFGQYGAEFISFAPLIAWPWLAAILVLALLPVLFALVRQARGGLLRLIAIAALGAVLLNPSLVKEKRDPIRDVALIVVDRSESQTLGKRAERTDAALAMLKQKLAAFPDLETNTVTIGADSNASGETDLFGSLNEAASDIPHGRLAGAILLTDGEVHDVPAQPAQLADIGPVQTLLTGERDERDRKLGIVAAPAYGIVGKTASITIRVDDTKGIGQENADVTYAQDGGDPQTISVAVGRDTPIEVPLAHGGQTIVTFDAAPVEGELTLKNNRAAVMINAVRDRLKVLLVSGEPYPGERTWRNLLKADPSVDLVHFTILRPPEKQDGTPLKELSLIAFPIKELFEQKLKQFDLIIFDRYEQRGILPETYYDNIRRYVEGGGALLDASGPALAKDSSLYHTPLGAILPSEPVEGMLGAFKPGITEIGHRHPVTAGLSDPSQDWGRWFRQTDVQPKENAVTIMSGLNDRPLLILSHVGEGRVAQLTSDQLWLWSRGYDGGGPQAELMKRLAHWLMKEPALEENDLRAHVDGNRLTVERVSLQPGGPDIQVTDPSGKTTTLKLADSANGLETGATDANETGIYKITDGQKTIFAIAGALDAPEFRDVLTTAGKLQPVADATGGSIHYLADDPDIEVRRIPAGHNQFGGSWIGLRQNGQYTVSGTEALPLVPVTLVLLVALAGLILGWRREGK